MQVCCQPFARVYSDPQISLRRYVAIQRSDWPGKEVVLAGFSAVDCRPSSTDKLYQCFHRGSAAINTPQVPVPFLSLFFFLFATEHVKQFKSSFYSEKNLHTRGGLHH